MESVPPTIEGHKATHVRYSVLAMIFAVSTLNYASRATLSIAGPAAQKQLGCSALQLGYVFSAFGYTYVIAQIPSGWLLDRFGSKNVYACSILAWSAFTFFQGFAGLFRATAAFAALLALRLLLGLAEAPAFPGNGRIVAAWFPAAERATASAVFNSSQYFATFLFAPLSGWIVYQFGWTWVFFVTGGLGVVMASVWMKTIYAPASHPRVGALELDFMQRGGALIDMERALENSRGKPPGRPHWAAAGKLIGNRMLLGVYLGQFSINTITVFFATWFPLYLVQERHMSILKAGLAASLPALCGFAGGILGGVLSDGMLKRGYSLSTSRKVPIVAGMLLAMTMVVCNYVATVWLVVPVMSLAFLGKGCGALGWAVVADTSPQQFAGLSGGLFNMFGNLSTIVTPLVIGYLVDATKSYQSALLYVAANAAVAIFAYLFVVGEIKRVELPAL
jgi:ACS family glucarate transporter-like MFS transporter